MTRFKKFIWRWGPALAMMGVIFFASSTPQAQLPSVEGWDTVLRKGGHALGYALLGVAYAWGLAGRRPTGRVVARAVLLAALYAVSDELHQAFTPGRSSSPVDVGIDTAGALAGACLWWWAQVRRERVTRAG